MLKILDLKFLETGQYQDMMLRPYQAVVNERHLHIIQENTQGGTNLSTGALVGIAGQIVAPTTNAMGVVGIDNGWGTRRLRFVIVVETDGQFGGRTLQYLTGYTDHADQSYSGRLDPRMRLYFNNSLLTQVLQEHTPFGVQESQRVVDASQLLMGQYSMGFGSMGHESTVMRPMDVFASQSTQFLRDFTQRPVIDGRTNFGVDTLKKSNRKNGAATTYLGKLLQSHHTCMVTSDQDSSTEQLMGHARGLAKEALVAEDAFLAEMNLRTSLRQSGSICYGELLQFDSTLEQRAEIYLQQATHQLATGYVAKDSGEHWRGNTHSTMAATIMSHAIPAIMMDLMINQIAFSATNKTPGSVPSVVVTAPPRGFASVDMAPFADMFLQRLTFEVLNDISANNQMLYDIHAWVDAIGESRFEISINNEPHVPYVTPSFCDARFTPVLANNPQTLHDLSASIVGMADRLRMDYSVQNVHGQQFPSTPTQLVNSHGYLDVL